MADKEHGPLRRQYVSSREETAQLRPAPPIQDVIAEVRSEVRAVSECRHESIARRRATDELADQCTKKNARLIYVEGQERLRADQLAAVTAEHQRQEARATTSACAACAARFEAAA